MIDGHIHIENQPYNLDIINKMEKVAIDNGINEIFVLDHTHKFIEFSFLYSNIIEKNTKLWYDKKKLISINEYLNFINIIKQNQFPTNINFELEVCCFKDSELKLKEVLERYNFDFTIGSIHFVNNIAIDITKDIYKDLNVG